MAHQPNLQTVVSDRLSPNEFEVLQTFEFGALYLLPDFLTAFEATHSPSVMDFLSRHTKVNLGMRAVPDILFNLYERNFVVVVKISDLSYLKLSQKGNMAVYGKFDI